MATYQQLFNLCKKKFNISWLYGQSHANEKLFLTEKAKQYPTLCVGFLNIIHPDRLHIIGPAEIEFFNQISHDARVGFLQKLVENKSLGLVVCLDLALPDDMIQPLIDTNLPVFGTSEPPEKVLTFVRHNIVKLLAPSALCTVSSWTYSAWAFCSPVRAASAKASSVLNLSPAATAL